MRLVIGVPPKPVTRLLRLEGAAVVIAGFVGFALSGANWWLFLLVIVPDLTLFAVALGGRRAAIIYDLAHTYVWSVLLVAAGLFPATSWMLPLGLIWAIHIGIDRALGYGLRYPEAIETTHLGPVGRGRKGVADAAAT